MKYSKIKLTSARLLALSFAGVVLVGAVLLTLPVSARSGVRTGFIDALFTSASATCVTGLVPFDTFTHWSTFGQLVILILIQIGGIGLMTMISLFAMMLGRKINLSERKLLMDSAGSLQISGIVRLVRGVAAGTFVCEGFGFALLSFRFCRDMETGAALYSALFHTVSAFCNAGFDVLGRFAPNTSLGLYVGDTYVNLVISALIIVGGIGFFVWSDIAKNKLHFRQYELHTKIVLTVTAILLFSGTVLFFISEYNNAFSELGFGDSLLASFFQSVTTRTAGFATVDQGKLSGGGRLLSFILMMTGGSPGSTAGGIKTTTLAVVLLNIIASARRADSVTVFKHRLEPSTVKTANAIFAVYMSFVLVSSFVICTLQPSLELDDVLFETVSAIGTVGLTTGITPLLGGAAKLIVTALMFMGRIGGLTIVLALAEKRERLPLNRPVGKIIVG